MDICVQGQFLALQFYLQKRSGDAVRGAIGLPRDFRQEVVENLLRGLLRARHICRRQKARNHENRSSSRGNRLAGRVAVMQDFSPPGAKHSHDSFHREMIP